MTVATITSGLPVGADGCSDKADSGETTGVCKAAAMDAEIMLYSFWAYVKTEGEATVVTAGNEDDGQFSSCLRWLG